MKILDGDISSCQNSLQLAKTLTYWVLSYYTFSECNRTGGGGGSWRKRADGVFADIATYPQIADAQLANVLLVGKGC